MRLDDGAAVHQPNPAGNGTGIQVEMWLRSASEGDLVHITVDFRDQTMWTTPLQTETHTFALSTGWESYVLQATAPSPRANPVFHTRLTIQADAGATVDLDDVSMLTTP